MSSPTFATAAELQAALAWYDAHVAVDEIATPRYRLRFVCLGPVDGSPLVFVHGLCDLPRSFAMVMKPLAEAGFRILSYDLADGRRDGCNLGMYRHADLSADLVELLDHLGIAETDIVGSSFGSTVTLSALHRYPRHFRRAVLKGGFARRPLMRIERGLARLGRYWPWLMGDLPIRESVMMHLEKPMFAGAADEVFAFLLANSGRTPCRAAARRALILDKLDLRPTLPEIPHPVLMIGGDRDTIVPRHLEADVEAGLRNVRRIEFAPCGHYPQYTLPSRTAAEIEKFLRG